MNKPRDENNFLIEVTPEVLSELRGLYINVDEDPVSEIHYSPYWSDDASPKPLEEDK